METALAAIILTKYEENDNEYDFSYKLPIMKIDNLTILAILSVGKPRKSLIFYVDSNIVRIFGNKQYFKYYISSDSTIIDYKYTVEDFTEAIVKIQELLLIMKFDKLIGRFSIDNTISEQEKQYAETLFNSPNVTLIYEECSVCQDCTTTKTKCGHSLCYPCWENIKRVEYTDHHENVYEHQTCPECRTVINVKQLNVDQI